MTRYTTCGMTQSDMTSDLKHRRIPSFKMIFVIFKLFEKQLWCKWVKAGGEFISSRAVLSEDDVARLSEMEEGVEEEEEEGGSCTARENLYNSSPAKRNEKKAINVMVSSLPSSPPLFSLYLLFFSHSPVRWVVLCRSKCSKDAGSLSRDSSRSSKWCICFW